MRQEDALASLRGMLIRLHGCCLHKPQWLFEDVEEVLGWATVYSEQKDSLVIVRLGKDGCGGYGLLTETSDATGHGCACSSSTVREPTLGQLFMHVTSKEGEALIRAEPVRAPE